MQLEDANQKFEYCLQSLITDGGADLHIREDRPVYKRVNRQAIPFADVPAFSREQVLELLRNFLQQEKLDQLGKDKSVDFSVVSLGRRLRGNAFIERGKLALVCRLIPHVQTFNDLNLPDALTKVAMKEQGFFLVTGSVGNGKSTTMASMLSLINKEKQKHLITIEDPIEFFYEDGLSFIDQREIGIDVDNFEMALKNALRQDADVLVVGEMRNKETIGMAITAAQTGHLVFSTLHTNSASQTVERILDVFPAEAQKEIRVELSASLLGVFSQKLVMSTQGKLVPAYELMLNTAAVAHLIREGRTKDIDMVIENGVTDGQVSFNRCLADFVKRGIITQDTAFLHTRDEENLKYYLT